MISFSLIKNRFVPRIMYRQITILSAKEFQQVLLTSNSKHQVVDCREPFELQLASIRYPTINLPMSEASKWTEDVKKGNLLDANTKTICLCHHGVRSMKVATYLSQNGFTDVCNVEGGIEAYACDVDSTIGRY